LCITSKTSTNKSYGYIHEFPKNHKEASIKTYRNIKYNNKHYEKTRIGYNITSSLTFGPEKGFKLNKLMFYCCNNLQHAEARIIRKMSADKKNLSADIFYLSHRQILKDGGQIFFNNTKKKILNVFPFFNV